MTCFLKINQDRVSIFDKWNDHILFFSTTCLTNVYIKAKENIFLSIFNISVHNVRYILWQDIVASKKLLSCLAGEGVMNFQLFLEV